MRGLPFALTALLATAVTVGCDDEDGADPTDAGPALDMAPLDMTPLDMAFDAALPDATPDGGAPAPIDITGDYLDTFDQPHRITLDAWAQGPVESESVTTFTVVDNAAMHAVGQNADDHPFNPSAWSRFDYTFHAAGLWYCQSVFDAPDEATALAAPPPDASDPATAGCGGFPWSMLIPAATALDAGDYIDGFDTPHHVDATTLTIGADDPSVFVLTDVGPDHAIARNGDDNAFNPGAWSRFDFTTAADQLYICQSAYDAASAADARAVSADPGNPAEGGCGMFAWSALNPVE